MSKSQNGNKEAKKPKAAKKVVPPNPPGLPSSLMPLVAGVPKAKKR